MCCPLFSVARSRASSCQYVRSAAVPPTNARFRPRKVPLCSPGRHRDRLRQRHAGSLQQAARRRGPLGQARAHVSGHCRPGPRSGAGCEIPYGDPRDPLWASPPPRASAGQQGARQATSSRRLHTDGITPPPGSTGLPVCQHRLIAAWAASGEAAGRRTVHTRAEKISPDSAEALNHSALILRITRIWSAGAGCI